MIAALFKAVSQMSDPRLRSVLWMGVGGALLCYLALIAAVWYALGHTRLFTAEWAETWTDVLGGVVALVLPLLFFPALATTVMSPLLERVADAVEERHYPQLNWPRPQSWAEVLGSTLKFLLVIVAVNALALPVYAILLITGISLPLALVINGYLLGREYYELVALRRLDPPAARLLFRNRLGRLWLAGIVIAFLFSIPVVNLAAPVVAAAFMVHLFHSLRKDTPSV